MPSLEYDLAYLQACSGDLEDYLLSNVLYWPISGRPPKDDPPFPRLTLGGILLAQKRVAARGEIIPPDVAQSLEAVKTRWQSNWERKSDEERGTRRKRWEDFLRSYPSDPAQHARDYSGKVYQRVIIELLTREITTWDVDEPAAVAGLDRILRNVFVSGDFCWDSELSQGFSEEEYWFLYGGLKN